MIYNAERPKTFDEMKGQYEIVNNIRNQSKAGNFFSVYILGGQFGSGKTSMSIIITLAANCSHVDENGNPCLECDNCKMILNNQTSDVIELDGASHTGVESIRNLIETVSYMPTIKKKVYIIDEVHMLSKAAFNALLKTLEEPPEHCIFILCTTEIHAIPVTVRSRAAIYYFGQIKDNDIVEHLEQIAAKYAIQVDDNVYKLIAKNSSGSLRNALALLEQVSKIDKRVTVKDVEEMLGVSDPKYVFELLGFMLKNDTSNCIKSIEKLTKMGIDLFLLVSDMLDICSDAVIAACSDINELCNTEYYKEQLGELLSLTNQKQICLLANALIKVRSELRKMPTKTTLVVEVIRITTDVQTLSNDVMKRLDFLESKLKETELTVPVYNSVHTSEITCNDSSVKGLENDNLENIPEQVCSITTDTKIQTSADLKSEEYETQDQDPIKREEIDERSIDENHTDTENQSDTVNYDKESDTEQYDVFDLLDMFGKVDFTSETVENSEESKMDEEVIKLSSNMTQITNEVVSHGHDCILYEDINFTYDFSDDGTNINVGDLETQYGINTNLEENISEQVDDSLIENEMKHLEALYTEFPMLESAIELGCTVTVVDENVLLYTKLKPIYDIVKPIIVNYQIQIDIELIE